MASAVEFVSEGSVVRRWKQKMQRCSGSSSVLPPEIIENILSRLPVKDLLRFKVVSKQWEATISDPIFAEIHLQYHKNLNSSSRNHLLAFHKPQPGDNIGLHIAELRNNCIDFLSAYEPSTEYVFTVVNRTFCCCDGLYLKCCPCKEGQPSHYVLWNPSCRTYRKLYCPPIKFNRRIHGMYYDPLMKDYKIVIADMYHYVVYSCKGNKWGDMKEMKGVWGECCPADAVYVDGSVYWLSIDYVNMGEFYLEKPREVICFDCKNENFKTLPLPTTLDLNKRLHLTSFGGHLCLLIRSCQHYSSIEIMKKVSSSDGKDGWMESKEECLCGYKSKIFQLVCILSENEILVKVVSMSKIALLLYDKSKNTLEKILNKYDKIGFMYPLPYMENLLLL